MTYDYSKGSEFIAYDTAMGNVSKTRQVVMLYDGVISFLQRACEAKKNQDFQEHYNMLDRACKIIQGLQASLDHDNGGEISKILEKFYINIFASISQLFHPAEENQYNAIAQDVKKMRDAWEHVDKGNSSPEEVDDNSQGADITQEVMEQVVDEASSEGVSISA